MRQFKSKKKKNNLARTLSILTTALVILTSQLSCQKKNKKNDPPPSSALNLVGTFEGPNTAFDLAISGDLGVVAGGKDGIKIYSLANPEGPVLIQSYYVNANITKVLFIGSVVYALDQNQGLIVIDITNPVAPVRVTPTVVALTDDMTRAISILQTTDRAGRPIRLLLGANLFNQLTVYNISDLSKPKQLGLKAAPNDATYYDIAVSRDYIFTSEYSANSSGQNRVGVYQLSKNNDLVKINEFVVLGHSLQLSFKDNILAVSEQEEGLALVDTTDPNNLAEVSQIKTDEAALDQLFLKDHLLVVTSNNRADHYNFLLYNIGDLSAPYEQENFQFQGKFRRVVAYNNVVYVVSESHGIQMLKMQGDL